MNVYVKRILTILGILILINFIILIQSLAVENNIDIKSQFNKDSNSLTVEVSCGQNLKEVKMYKKVGDKLIVFYVSSNINFTNKFYKIPSTYLSYDAETDIIVDATDEQGNRNTAHFVAPKIPTYTPAPTTSSNPSQSAKPSTSATPSQKPSTPQKPSSTPTTNQEIKLTIDKSVLMLDKTHYRFSILKATVSPSDAVVTFKSNNNKVATVAKNSGLITAKGYGTVNITATAKFGKKTKTATCKVRVITTMKEKTSDSGHFPLYKKEYGGWQDYYIRYYNSSKKKVTKNSGWSIAEVESYINNAEWLLKNYPQKFSESAKCTYYYYPTCNRNYELTATKKKGKIAPNEWLLLFTSKNQHLYLLKKNSKGVWKVNESMRSSAGYYWGGFNKHVGKVEPGFGGWAFGMYKDPSERGILWRNAIHLSTLIPGYPTSGGCIHLGDSSSVMYKKLVNICKTQQKTIKIIYY